MSATQVTSPSSLIRGSARRSTLRRRDVATLTAVAVAILAGVALLLGPPSGTDLAAQQARATFAAHHPGAAVDLNWFGGVQPAAYSVLSPYLMALLGVRLTGVVAAVVGAGLVGVLLRRWDVRRPVLGAAWAAVMLVLDVTDGRVTFALGLTLALGALAAVPRQVGSRPRWLPSVALAALSGFVSPVAAVYLALVTAGWAVRRRSVATLVVAALVPLGVIHLLFPESGRMPDRWHVVWPPLLAAVAVALLCRDRVVRLVASAYAVAVLVVFMAPGPVGSNDERLAVLFTGTVLICCTRLPRPLLAVAMVVVALWSTRVPLRDLRAAPELQRELTASRQLVGQLRALAPMTGRVEVVPFRNHAESQVVAPVWPIARGWERQVDLVRAAPLYAAPLTPAAYLQWLRDNAVQYVALGHHPHDFGAAQELALLRHPPPYLVPVPSGPQWSIWRVVGSRPLVSAPARLVAADPAQLRISVPAAGRYTVDVRWSRWWRVSGGGCLSRDGHSVALRTTGAVSVTLSSSYAHPAGGPHCG